MVINQESFDTKTIEIPTIIPKESPQTSKDDSICGSMVGDGLPPNEVEDSTGKDEIC